MTDAQQEMQENFERALIEAFFAPDNEFKPMIKDWYVAYGHGQVTVTIPVTQRWIIGLWLDTHPDQPHANGDRSYTPEPGEVEVKFSLSGSGLEHTLHDTPDELRALREKINEHAAWRWSRRRRRERHHLPGGVVVSARFCSSCRRRVWWWQVWMPKSRQCLPCSVLAEQISWLYIRGLDDDVCNQLWQDAKMPPDPFYDLTSCPIAECSIPIRHTHDNDDPRLSLNKFKKEGS